MSNIVEIIVNAVDNASAAFESIQSAGSGAADMITSHWKEIAVAAGAAGAGLELVARTQQQLTEDTKKLASATGMSEESIRNLALETSNVTFPLQDVLDLMQQAHALGIEGAEGLREYADFWDMVGDATGGNAVALGEAGVALRALGIDAGNESEALNAFGYITQNTTMSIEDFLRFVDRSGPEIREMGMSVDDTAAMLGYLQKEFGMSARVARTEFEQAVNQSEGSMEKLFEILGVAPDKFGEYQQAVSDSAGVIEEYRDINNDTYTTMQKLQHTVSELGYKFGSLVGAIEPLAPVMMAVAPAVTIFAQLAPAAKAAGGVMPLLSGGLGGVAAAGGGAVAALLPFLPIIAGVAVAAAALYLAWKTNFLGIQDVVAGAKDYISDRFEGIKTALSPLEDKLCEAADRIKDAFGQLFGKVDELFQKFTGGVGIVEVIGKAFELWGRIMDKVWEIIGDKLCIAVDLLVAGLEILCDWVGKVVDWFTELCENPVVSFLIDKVGGAIDWVGDKIDGFLPELEETDKHLKDVGETAETSGDQIVKMGEDGVSSFDTLMEGSNALAATEEVNAVTKEQALELYRQSLEQAGFTAEETEERVRESANRSVSDIIQASREINNAWEQGASKELIVNFTSTGGQTSAQASPYVQQTGNAPGTALVPGNQGQIWRPNNQTVGTLTAQNMDGSWSDYDIVRADSSTGNSQLYVTQQGAGLSRGGIGLNEASRVFGSNHRISWMASGGRVTGGGLAIIGERGPEMVYVPEGAQVNPSREPLIDYQKLATAVVDAMRSMKAGQGGGGEHHWHIGTLIADKGGLRKLAREVDLILTDESIRRGVTT